MSEMELSRLSMRLVELAVKEDLGSGDVTSRATMPDSLSAAADFIAKEPLVVCGHSAAQAVFERIDSALEYRVEAEDGAPVTAGSVIAAASGPARSLLAAERTALNFLQRLSGIATMTADVVQRVQGTGVHILDTRKTTPGWRELEKYAVRCGGGMNHRIGLYDAVLIKDNHIDAVGGDVRRAIAAARETAPQGMKIEVEVRSMEELAEAFVEHPDAVLLDNMSPAELRRAVDFVRSQPGGESVELEASGGITPETLREYAAVGVDSISLGMLTHSARAVDISMKYRRS